MKDLQALLHSGTESLQLCLTDPTPHIIDVLSGSYEHILITRNAFCADSEAICCSDRVTQEHRNMGPTLMKKYKPYLKHHKILVVLCNQFK